MLWRKRAILAPSACVVTILLVFAGSGVTADEPGGYVTEQRWDGHLACSARNQGVPGFGIANCAFWDVTGALGPHQSQYLTQADAGLKSIVVAMVWEPSEHSWHPYLQHDLFVTLPNDQVSGMNYAFRDGAALPGLEYRLDADPSDPYTDWDAWTTAIPIEFRISAGYNGEPNLVLQQPFTVHLHLFYGEHAPEGYSALP